jgi:KTSC domain
MERMERMGRFTHLRRACLLTVWIQNVGGKVLTAGYTLSVEFHSGRIYDHPGVPESVFHELMDALSKGGYYNQFIRGRFR